MSVLCFVGLSDRVQVWVPADALEVARAEAALVGVSVNVWLERAAVELVEQERGLRELEQRERERWGGWHPNDAMRAST